MRPLHKRDQAPTPAEREPSAVEREFDRRRAIVAEVITGIECVREGSFEFYGIQGRDGLVTPENAHTTLERMRSRFSEAYPELFPDAPTDELSASQSPRSSDVYKYPAINAQGTADAWTGQANNSGL